jgi:hypothetical protein
MALSAGVTVKVAISPPIAAREPRQRSTAREDGHPQSRNTTGIIGKPVLENAIRHTPLGAHIAVTADPVGSIVVEDDGPGLRDDLVPDLLQPFKKVRPGARVRALASPSSSSGRQHGTSGGRPRARALSRLSAAVAWLELRLVVQAQPVADTAHGLDGDAGRTLAQSLAQARYQDLDGVGR